MGKLAPHLRPVDLDVAREHYASSAPEALARSEPAAVCSSARLERARPGRAQATPAVSRLRWLSLEEGDARSLLVCEMRLSSLYRVGLEGVERLGRYLNGPVQVHRADLEGDGRAELIVAGIGDPSPTPEKKGWVSVLRSWPRSKPPERLLERLGRPANLELGDLDGDGDLDLVVCAFGFRGPGELLLATQAAPARFERRCLDPRDGFVAALVRDLDEDGLADVVALVAQEHEELVWLRQTAPGRFEPHVLHRAPHPGWGYSSLTAADLDGDGDEDLVLGNGDAADHPVVVKPYHGVAWLERGEGAAPSYRYRRIGSLPGCEAVAVGDIDGDGDQDVAAGSFLPLLEPHEWRARQLDSLVWFEQRSGGAWARHVLERGVNTRASVAIVDLDGDGRAELAAGNFLWRGPREAPLVTIYRDLPHQRVR